MVTITTAPVITGDGPAYECQHWIWPYNKDNIHWQLLHFDWKAQQVCVAVAHARVSVCLCVCVCVCVCVCARACVPTGALLSRLDCGPPLKRLFARPQNELP